MNSIATCDKKHRLIVRDAEPGKQYLVRGLVLELMEEPKPAKSKRRMTAKEVLAAMDKRPIRFTAEWEDIRKETREP